ncbi:MAG: redoxin domain-containing protein [Bacteroidales bacterium]|nr:redoxin domain-containing protein [Bacteroidales bacterium]
MSILKEGDLAPSIGVSTDNEKSHRKFISKYKLPFRLISDVEKIIGKVITKEHGQQIFTELSH